MCYTDENTAQEGTTMTDAEHRAAAKKFVIYWTGKGDEKREVQ